MHLDTKGIKFRANTSQRLINRKIYLKVRNNCNFKLKTFFPGFLPEAREN